MDKSIEQWPGGPGQQCRLLVGMQKLPQDELRESLSLLHPGANGSAIDNQTALRLKRRLAEEFRTQLTIGAPTNADEAGLQQLASQLREKKLVVKLFLKHPLHAKLYLCFRKDNNVPIVGYLGSSNLTASGLSYQGELNVDVVDGDAAQKLAKWFEDRWSDKWCVDISQELIQIIEESWAREVPVPPFHIYIKMAYHLSQEARAGLSEFRLPKEFQDKLFPFQSAAVRIAAHHVHKRGGVLLGDVVGLGKTLMATAVARILEDDCFYETLILCPKNLVPMWEQYRMTYRMHATVVSMSTAPEVLADLPRHRLVIIDESHNLRNREGQRYRAILEYLQKNESKVVLLSATPYNKTYLDLSSQLRLFVPEDRDLGVRPERLLQDLGETEFLRRHQCQPRTLAAFEKSEYADDWRELMRLYMVRRTRGFIQANYAGFDEARERYFLQNSDHTPVLQPDGSRIYFPVRQAKTVKFRIREDDPDDQLARLYSEEVVGTINRLHLPRYGLGNYIRPRPATPPTTEEARQINGLSRAGKRLMGFCRTNLFKRLESSGVAFLQSVERHLLRNYVFLHALDNGLPVPVGQQGAELLDSRVTDEDEADGLLGGGKDRVGKKGGVLDEAACCKRAAEIYAFYDASLRKRFTWMKPALFVPALAEHLRADCAALFQVLARAGTWDPAKDSKLNELIKLLAKRHAGEKILLFTQFADTVDYLVGELHSRGVHALAGVSGDSADPTDLARRFSPRSNAYPTTPANELRVLIATDVLSEGQNLQDCAVVVNYDLPWAIIRLIQRAGRVDRIGQQSDTILCYSFLPAEGVEKIIRLRARVRQRLQENGEVVGSDETFFEDQLKNKNDDAVRNLYNEKGGILDGEEDTEVDLTSLAYQIWRNAVSEQPELEKIVPDLPPVIFSAKRPAPTGTSVEHPSALLYLRSAEGNDALAWINAKGESVTTSQLTILRAAECARDTPAVPRADNHHGLVARGAQLIAAEEKTIGGGLGRPSGARFRTYERLKRHATQVKGTLFDTKELARVVEAIYRFPLRGVAADTLNRQLRAGIDDETLAQLAVSLHQEDRLCVVQDDSEVAQEPQIICSLGLTIPPAR